MKSPALHYHNAHSDPSKNIKTTLFHKNDHINFIATQLK